MPAVTPKKPFQTADGRTFETLEKAIMHADKIRSRLMPEYVWRRSGPGKADPYYVIEPDGSQHFKGFGRIDVTKHFRRERKVSPSSCAAGSFRAKKNKSGTLLTFCCPRGKWQPRKQRCKVSMKLQSIGRPRRR